MASETEACSESITNRLENSWLGKADLHPIASIVGTPVFVYSEEQLLRNVARVKNAAAAAGLDQRVELYVPFFPNSNPHLLHALQATGLGLLLQVPGEHKILHRFGFSKFIVSPGHVSDDEIGFWADKGYLTFLSSLDEADHWLRTTDAPISVRIDSLGSEKPGIKYGQLQSLSQSLRDHNRPMECFEVYCGSGRSLDDMINILEQVFTIFKTHFPDARSINFAGGHGFVYEKWDESEKHFDWQQYFSALRELATRFGVPDHVKFFFEPARDVLADVGALLLGVKRDIVRNPVANLVVTDGCRMLMPSAQLRSRRHNIAFLDTDMKEIPSSGNGFNALVRGRTILRNDYILPGEYWVPEGVRAHGYMLILDVGAYCATQHMEFLNVPPAAEVLIDVSGTPYLITERGDELDKWRHLLPEKQALTAPTARSTFQASGTVTPGQLAADAVERPHWVRSGDFTAAEEPLKLFQVWFQDASRSEPSDPNAMTLATVDADGMPNARMVLLKNADPRGFVFFTHATSAKGCELGVCPRAALIFHWKSLKRQVRVRGVVEPASAAEADDYFASRPRQSQIGAWASRQSTPLESRSVLEAAVADYTARYAEAVPRPPHWCGYLIVPLAIEFWHERPFRLHDRIVFKRNHADEPWSKTRLYP